MKCSTVRFISVSIAQVVDRLKRSFYAMLDDIRNRQALHNFGAGSYELVQADLCHRALG